MTLAKPKKIPMITDELERKTFVLTVRSISALCDALQCIEMRKENYKLFLNPSPLIALALSIRNKLYSSLMEPSVICYQAQCSEVQLST